MTSLKHNWGKTGRNADFLSLPHPRIAPRSNRTCVGRHISAGISAPLEKSGAKFHSQAPSAGIDFSFGGAGAIIPWRSLALFIHLVGHCPCPADGLFPTGFRSPIARSSPSVTQTIGGHGQVVRWAERSLSLSLAGRPLPARVPVCEWPRGLTAGRCAAAAVFAGLKEATAAVTLRAAPGSPRGPGRRWRQKQSGQGTARTELSVQRTTAAAPAAEGAA